MVFVVAQELGVGFTTLLEHLERTLGSVSGPAAAKLRRTSLKKRFIWEFRGWPAPRGTVVGHRSGSRSPS
jgi:hypothetical protein